MLRYTNQRSQHLHCSGVLGDCIFACPRFWNLRVSRERTLCEGQRSSSQTANMSLAARACHVGPWWGGGARAPSPPRVQLYASLRTTEPYALYTCPKTPHSCLWITEQIPSSCSASECCATFGGGGANVAQHWCHTFECFAAFALSLALVFFLLLMHCVYTYGRFFWLLFWINSAEIHYLKNLPQCCATLGAPPPMLRNIARHLPNVVQQNGYALFSPMLRNIGATPPVLRNIAAISTNAVQHWFHFLDTLATGCNVLLCGVLALGCVFGGFFWLLRA